MPGDGLTWNNGNRNPGWGVAEIQKMSPPTTVGDVADMQLCVIKQGSPQVLGNVAFFVTDLLTLARCAVCIHIVSNPPEKSHRCEAYVCCCPIFGQR